MIDGTKKTSQCEPMAERTITLDELSRRFGEISVRIADPSPAMRVGGIMGREEVRERFDTGTDPDGIPWQPLAYPRVNGGEAKPLRNFGLLMASYVSEFGRDYWKVGTNEKHARAHHYGATIIPFNVKWLTIPITKTAVYAGKARNQSGLHFRKRKDSDKAGLYDADGVCHWILVKRVVIPARRQVGVSDELMERWLPVLVEYLKTGVL